MAGLSDKQAAFVREYLIDLNASAAYQRAGYKAIGNAAESAASRLLRNVQVAEAIAAAQAERVARTEVTQDWVVERLKAEATLEGENSSHSARVSALRWLGLHLGMFPTKVQVTGKDGQPIQGELVMTDEQRLGALAALRAALDARSLGSHPIPAGSADRRTDLQPAADNDTGGSDPGPLADEVTPLNL